MNHISDASRGGTMVKNQFCIEPYVECGRRSRPIQMDAQVGREHEVDNDRFKNWRSGQQKNLV